MRKRFYFYHLAFQLRLENRNYFYGFIFGLDDYPYLIAKQRKLE